MQLQSRVFDNVYDKLKPSVLYLEIQGSHISVLLLFQWAPSGHIWWSSGSTLCTYGIQREFGGQWWQAVASKSNLSYLWTESLSQGTWSSTSTLERAKGSELPTDPKLGRVNLEPHVHCAVVFYLRVSCKLLILHRCTAMSGYLSSK